MWSGGTGVQRKPRVASSVSGGGIGPAIGRPRRPPIQRSRPRGQRINDLTEEDSRLRFRLGSDGCQSLPGNRQSARGERDGDLGGDIHRPPLRVGFPETSWTLPEVPATRVEYFHKEPVGTFRSGRAGQRWLAETSICGPLVTKHEQVVTDEPISQVPRQVLHLRRTPEGLSPWPVSLPPNVVCVGWRAQSLVGGQGPLCPRAPPSRRGTGRTTDRPERDYLPTASPRKIKATRR